MKDTDSNTDPAVVYRRVVTIAGSDSGGGAGIQADLKTFSALGCYGMSVITALTAQNTQGVFGIHAAPPEIVQAQMDAVFTDIGADAVKIGMLFSAELIRAVAAKLTEYAAGPIVLDPVMVAQSGDRLLKDDAVQAVRQALLPMAEIVTPNIPEASVLLQRDIRGIDDMAAAARDLANLGCRSVLIKGGHDHSAQASDILYIAAENRYITLAEPRIDTRNNHGTGCTLASAIAAYLASGETLSGAVQKAKAYITAAIRNGARYRLGQGHGPVHHFFEFWQ